MARPPRRRSSSGESRRSSSGESRRSSSEERRRRREPLAPPPISDHGGCLRVLYFLFVGCWLGPVVEAVGLLLIHTIVLWPVGAWVLERVPCFLTLRNYRWRPAAKQRNIVLRFLYFLLLGIWIGNLVTLLAHFLNAILIGLSIGQDLMEKRGVYYSLKQYVPRNLPLDDEPEVGGGAGPIVVVGLLLAGPPVAFAGYHLSQGAEPEELPTLFAREGRRLGRWARNGLDDAGVLDWAREAGLMSSKDDARIEASEEIFEAGIRYRDKGHLRAARKAFEYVAETYPELPISESAKEEIERIDEVMRTGVR